MLLLSLQVHTFVQDMDRLLSLFSKFVHRRFIFKSELQFRYVFEFLCVDLSVFLSLSSWPYRVLCKDDFRNN